MNKALEWVRDKLLPIIIMAIVSTLISAYIDLKVLRNDVDRLEVYVDQLWKQK